MKIDTDPTGGSGATQAAREPLPPSRRRTVSTRQPVITTAVLFATAAAADGGPAAAQPWEHATVLRRMLDQLASLGVRTAHVITRPGWEDALRPSLDGVGLRAELLTRATPADDLRAVAEIARSGGDGGGLMAGYADTITHREALAGLLADPRVPTGVLVTGGRVGRPFAWRVRANRGRVVSSASPYHAVNRPNNTFLGVLKVASANRETLAGVAERLAALLDSPPETWQREFDYKAVLWRNRLARWTIWRARAEEEGHDMGASAVDDEPGEGGDDSTTGTVDLAAVELAPEDDAELDRRLAAAPNDIPSLLVVGLVRDGVHLSQSFLRRLFWARPLSPQGLERARERITHYDEEEELLKSAVKASDGFFTTFFVSPYSKYIARWCAHRGFTPNQITTVSLLIGIAAGVAFATGERAGLIAGALLLQAAFTTDCVDGQLARYTRTFSKLGAWLDSIFDRSKEYVVFAGLAIGASRHGDPVWLLAGAALTLQTMRHSFDFSYAAAQHQTIGSAPQRPLDDPWDGTGPMRPPPVVEPEAAEEESNEQSVEDEPDLLPGAPERKRPLPARVLSSWRRLDKMPGVAWIKRVVAFPIGERFAVISLTAALFSARTTFTVLLVWGSFAALYSLAGRLLRSLR